MKGECLRVIEMDVSIYAMRTHPFTVGQVNARRPTHVWLFRVSGIMKTLTFMRILYFNATFQGLVFQKRQEEFAPRDENVPCNAMHQIVPGRSKDL